ncbi:MAG: glutamate 5-kinase [Bacteroidota bacterium]
MNKTQLKIVVKVGTNVLTRADSRLDVTNISHLVDQLAELKQRGHEIILVSSGAVGAGRELLPSAEQLDPVIRRQMLSAIGQVRLMELYRQLFASHQLICGQVLATKEDFRDRLHYLNMRNCLEALLHDRVIPIMNENDVVSVTELMFTDNDELASLVTSMLNADKLIILSSVDGLYTGAPEDPASELLAEISAEDENALAHVAPVKSSFGRGGMGTKVKMAQQTARLGAEVILANGRRNNVLLDILAGKGPCTRIAPTSHQPSNVKKWLAQKPATKGAVTINAGAEKVLTDDTTVNSLLPVGITAVEGDFAKGDLLRILGPGGELVGIGVAQYDAETARGLVGQHGQKPLVHYDYLVLVG